GGRGDVLPESCKMLFPRNRPKTKRDLTNYRRISGFDRSHNERHKIGGHPDGVGESDDLLSVFFRLRANRGIGGGGQRWINDQGASKNSFEVWFIPAGEGAAGGGGLEPPCSPPGPGAGLVFVRTAVESAELVVQDAPEGQSKGPGPWSDRGRKSQSAAFQRFVEFDRECMAGSISCQKGGGPDLEVSSIEYDFCRWLI